MWKLFLVGSGGFVGSGLRYLVGGAVQRLSTEALLPWGTAVVNVTGCLAIGVLGGLVETRGILSPEARAFLMIGVLGGFTTFSTFGYETFQLLRDGQDLAALASAGGQVVLGLAAVWAGFAVARLAG